jgi:predicted secreted protein
MQSRRQSILKNHAMLGAPRNVVSLFWQRYNLRWRNPEKNIGELAAGIVDSQQFTSTGPASAAWAEVVPVAFRGRSCVDQLQGGKLTVLVDSKATAYVLGRQFGPALLAALAGRLGRGAVRMIAYRIRPAAIKSNAKDTRADKI